MSITEEQAWAELRAYADGPRFDGESSWGEAIRVLLEAHLAKGTTPGDDVIWPAMTLKDLAFRCFKDRPGLVLDIKVANRDPWEPVTLSIHRKMEVPMEYAKRLVAVYEKEHTT